MSDLENGNNITNVDKKIIGIIQSLWAKRKFILKVTSFFIFFGLFVAVFSEKEYSTSVTMIVAGPQVDGGGIAGLAQMAGLNLNNLKSEEVITVLSYPKVLASAPYLKELMYTKVKFSHIPNPITLYDYYTIKEYQKFNLLNSIKKYTLGLPGVLLSLIKGEQKPVAIDSTNSGYLQYTNDEFKVSKILLSKIAIESIEREGIIYLYCNMPDAFASTQVVETARLLLQKYITEYKVAKVQQNLNFIEERYNEVKAKFEKKQMELAYFRDSNRNLSTQSNITQEEKLTSESNLLYNVYLDLAKQFEQSKIKVKETLPVLTVIDPAVIPNKPLRPNKPAILIMYTLLGFFISSGYLLFLPYYRENVKRKVN